LSWLSQTPFSSRPCKQKSLLQNLKTVNMEFTFNEELQKIPETFLSKEELTAIETLKLRIQDLIQQNEDYSYDFYLMHWLRVQKYNVDKAETMIREAVKWRTENNIQNLLEEDFDQAVDAKLHVDLNGITKEGYPINCANAGKFRVREAINIFGKDAVYRHWFQILAKSERYILDARRKMDRESKATNQQLSLSYAKSWLIMNMTGLSLLEMLSVDVLSVMATTFQNQVKYFPVIGGTICCVNANKFFDVAFKIISPILKGSNVSVYVFGTNEEKWKPFILTHINADQIQLVVGNGTPSEKGNENKGCLLQKVYT
ncbi:unnamed protein product, partial [Allacma fusca]